MQDGAACGYRTDHRLDSHAELREHRGHVLSCLRPVEHHKMRPHNEQLAHQVVGTVGVHRWRGSRLSVLGIAPRAFDAVRLGDPVNHAFGDGCGVFGFLAPTSAFPSAVLVRAAENRSGRPHQALVVRLEMRDTALLVFPFKSRTALLERDA